MSGLLKCICNFFSSFLKHDAFEWLGIILTASGLLFAYLEIRKSRKTTELSNKQCLFDRRLINYFINKMALAELDRNWNIFESIVKMKSIKKTRVSVDVAAQLFLGISSFVGDYKNNNDFVVANELYNRKISELRIVPEESRIIFSHIDTDVGDFIEKYVHMLKCLYVAHQLYAGNVAEEKYIEEKVKDLIIAISLLKESLAKERNVLNLMKNELNLEEK